MLRAVCKQVSSKSPVVPTAKKAAAHRAIPKTKAHPKEASASKAGSAAAAAASAPKAAAAASDGASALKAEKKKRPPTEHAMMVGKLMRQGLSPEHLPPFFVLGCPAGKCIGRIAAARGELCGRAGAVSGARCSSLLVWAAQAPISTPAKGGRNVCSWPTNTSGR